MTTQSTSRPSEGLCIQAVADATGLSRTTIYQAAEVMSLGSPAHFRYQDRGVIYTMLGLCQLVQGLHELGHGAGAKLLAEVVRQARQKSATAAGVMSPDDARELARRWDLRAEQRAESIYGGQTA